MKNNSKDRPIIRQILFPANIALVNLDDELRTLEKSDPMELLIWSTIDESASA